MQFEAGYRLRMAAIEAFREPENRRERPDGPPAFAAELGILPVRAFRRRLPVVPGHERDDLDLFRIEARADLHS